MKKAKAAIATYKDNYIYNLTIITCKGDYINLITYDPIDVKNSYKERTYKTMIRSIINLCKSNGFQLESKKMFDSRFYNISLVNLDDNKGIIESAISYKG